MESDRIASTCLIVLIIFLVLSPTRVEPRSNYYDDLEASQVYSGLLSSRHFTYRSDAGEYVIEAETMDSNIYSYYLGDGLLSCFPRQEDMHLSDWQTLRNLEKAAQIAGAVPNHLELKIPYELVGREILEAQTNENGVLWVGFRKRYPNSSGIPSLSPVGFNERKDRALVYVSFVCDVLCGGADFWTLAKREGIWEIVEPASSCKIFY